MLLIIIGDQADTAKYRYLDKGKAGPRNQEENFYGNQCLNGRKDKAAGGHQEKGDQHGVFVTDPGDKAGDQKGGEGQAEILEQFDKGGLGLQCPEIMLDLQNHRPYTIEQNSEEKVINKQRNL